MPAKFSPPPSLGRLRRRARSLVHQHQAHDRAAADFLRAYHPAYTTLSTDDIFNKVLTLADAQLALSREQGMPAWSPAKFSHSPTIGKPRVIRDLVDRPEYRRELAAQRGLPPIGAKQVSSHGMEYVVIDHYFVFSLAGMARMKDSEYEPHIDELVPIISLSNLTPRLQELCAEVNRCTSKELLFCDTMPDKFPRQAAPGVHMVQFTQDPRCITFHLDASRLHEVHLAHELGHLWIEFVEGCEDWRCLRDQSNIARSVQFQHIQSFVLDLKVNDLIESRGFDMSIVNDDQREAIREIARHCANGDLPKTKRAAVGMANAIAAAILEQKRWAKSVLPSFHTDLATIQARQPVLYHLAEQFVSSVQRHGYGDRASIRRVIDECSALSFQATEDTFDPDRDLVEIQPAEWMRDKQPDFVPGLPVAAKLQVWKEAARRGLGANIRWWMGIAASGRVEVRLEDANDRNAAPIVLSMDIPLDQLDVSRLPQMVAPLLLPPQSPQRQPFQPPLKPALPMPHLHAPVYSPQSPTVQMAVPSSPMPASLPWHAQRNESSHPEFPFGRNYMPGIGRWLSQVGFEEQQAGEHPYVYARNNPVMYIDPSGNKPQGNKPVPIPPVGPGACLIVAAAINSAYYWTPQHACNHDYAHCITCCLLTKLVNAECAVDSQVLQDWQWPWDPPSSDPYRETACGNGIAIALGATGTCSDGCLKAYPWPWPRLCCATNPCCDMEEEHNLFHRETYNCCKFLEHPTPFPQNKWGI